MRRCGRCVWMGGDHPMMMQQIVQVAGKEGGKGEGL